MAAFFTIREINVRLLLNKLINLARGSFWSYRENILAGAPKGVDSVNKL